jgi:hypothetical protein
VSQLVKAATHPAASSLQYAANSLLGLINTLQGCAALSGRSASWNHQITRNPRRTSSPIRPDLVFATHRAPPPCSFSWPPDSRQGEAVQLSGTSAHRESPSGQAWQFRFLVRPSRLLGKAFGISNHPPVSRSFRPVSPPQWGQGPTLLFNGELASPTEAERTPKERETTYASMRGWRGPESREGLRTAKRARHTRTLPRSMRVAPCWPVELVF